MLVGLAGCGGSKPESAEAGSDSGDTCTPSQTLATVANQLHMPSTLTDGGFDIDGDGFVDNELSRVLGALGEAGFASQAAVDTVVASGKAPLLVQVSFSDSAFANDTCAEVTLAVAVAAPGIRFDGQDQLTRSAAIEPLTLGGTISEGIFTSASPNGVRRAIPLTLGIAGTVVSIPVNAVHVSFMVDAIAGTLGEGMLGGAILATDVQATLLPAVAAQLTAALSQGGPDASAITALFDTGGQAADACGTTCQDEASGQCAAVGDGRIDPCELAGNGLIGPLLAPDVTILDPNGNVAPDHFRTPHDALSFALTFTASSATY